MIDSLMIAYWSIQHDRLSLKGKIILDFAFQIPEIEDFWPAIITLLLRGKRKTKEPAAVWLMLLDSKIPNIKIRNSLKTLFFQR